ncbi:MAG: MBL fold metallo-hydrolase [Alphaproteobacteria bacterium]|nr:MBL fold metallo-hydrolase [Alphaproteobacteria bacterium]
MEIRFHGAAGEVTGSCHLVEVGGRRILLDCGLIQGDRQDEERNREPFPFDPKTIDAVVLSHAHIDHSGRIPLLIRSGFAGPVYTHHASKDLCRIMLKDSGYLAERDAEWENRKRLRKGLKPVQPLYDMRDAVDAMKRFRGLPYGKQKKILPGVTVRFLDAGHILGSSIVELWLEEGGERRKIVFSGDLGQKGAPILRDPTPVAEADLVIMESTYGDRLHRGRADTRAEIEEVIAQTRGARGNILIPAFAVGRTQDILYNFALNYDAWGIGDWRVFLDSPMAIQATEVYLRHAELYDREAAALWGENGRQHLLPNLTLSRTGRQSMQLNRVHSGAIIIAGSGMCNGGRIRHHLKHNIWRSNCHVVIVGFQARGTLGRALVDGARNIRLWGETIKVEAKIHTIGGLSAHADRGGLMEWYGHFNGRPPVMLVHGEPEASAALMATLGGTLKAPVGIAAPGQRIDLVAMSGF